MPPPETAVDEVFTIVEQMPEFPGGQDALFAYLAKNIHYPDAERKNGIQGRVFIGYVVDREGMVGDVKVMRGIAGGQGLELEAIRVIKAMPKWIPGMQNGKPVAVQMNIPVSFKL